MATVSLLIGLLAFGGGTWLLVESVEALVAGMRGWAAAAGVSGIALAALVLGFDVESTAAGVAATLDDLPGTALGTSVGAAILLVTLGLGLAGVVAPFTVDAPRPMLASAAVAALLPSALMLDGRLSRVDGVILLLGFPPLLAVTWRALGRRAAAEPAGKEPSGRLWPRVLLAVAGLVIGAEILVSGVGRVVDELSLSETAFGLLAVALAVSLEELVLEMLPAYRGFPELTVGNALGTLIFLLTGSLGVIVLVRPLQVPDAVIDWHVPALVVTTAVALGVLARGRVGRLEGVALIALYAAYVAGALLVP